MGKSRRFTLVLDSDVAEAFVRECVKRGTQRTTVLRSFVRQWLVLPSADFAVVRIDGLSLGELMELSLH